MEAPSPLQDLIVYFRKHERLPDDWAARFSATAVATPDLDAAVAAAWQSDTDAQAMLRLAVHWADAKALSLVSVGFGRMLLKYLPKKNQVARKAVDFLETWATTPGAAAPRQGWRALADSVDPEEDKEDRATQALSVIGAALTVPDRPSAIHQVAQGVLSLKAGELIDALGHNATEEEIDEIDDLAGQQILGPMADIVRQFIPAPTADTFLRALSLMRAQELSEALERKNSPWLKAFRPD